MTSIVDVQVRDQNLNCSEDSSNNDGDTGSHADDYRGFAGTQSSTEPQKKQ